MKMKKNIVLRASEEWTKDDEHKLKSIIIDNFRELLNRSEEEGLYWTGTQRDLIELAHIVWESGQILEMNGNPMCFKSIVHHICRVLHVNEPCNPSCVVSEVRLRKNVKSSPLTTVTATSSHRQRYPTPCDLRFAEAEDAACGEECNESEIYLT